MFFTGWEEGVGESGSVRQHETIELLRKLLQKNSPPIIALFTPPLRRIVRTKDLNSLGRTRNGREGGVRFRRGVT